LLDGVIEKIGINRPENNIEKDKKDDKRTSYYKNHSTINGRSESDIFLKQFTVCDFFYEFIVRNGHGLIRINVDVTY